MKASAPCGKQGIAPDFRHELASFHVIKLIVAKLRPVRRCKDNCYLLAAFEKHPTANHLTLVEGVEHPFMLKDDATLKGIE
jgi:hypothetical protein